MPKVRVRLWAKGKLRQLTITGDIKTLRSVVCQNVSMNEQIAKALINSEMRQLEALSYAHLVTMIGKVETKELVGEDGKIYQLEIQAFWDSKKGEDVRLIVAADDGGWRVFKPLTDSFIMRSDGSLV